MKVSEIKLCDLHSEGAIKRLTKKATIVCTRCGAKSYNPTNLCEPVELASAASG